MASTPHIRLVYPDGIEKGLLRTSRQAKTFITFPDGEERELPMVRTATFRLGIDDADLITLELYGTVEVQYGN